MLPREPYLILHNCFEMKYQSLVFHSSTQTRKSFKIIANKQLHFVAKSFESYVSLLSGLQVSPKEKGVTGK